MGILKAFCSAFVIYLLACSANLVVDSSTVFLGACIIAAGYVAYHEK